MQISGLKELHQDMKRNGITRTQFQYRHNQVVFDVMFFTDGAPYKLLFGAIGERCCFVVNVQRGYNIDPFLQPKSAYNDLCRVLGIEYDPDNPFSTAKFFRHFAENIPDSISSTKEPLVPSKTQAEIVDDGNKIFFSHWRNNGLSSHVTNLNLTKTRKAFGPEIESFCSERNISSCWSVTEKAW
ncbi:DUF6037 family protein [Citrobacter amalonaticus]|uniref:DUF6037 family protein n=1 Tax=Citrobacter amalonaticus TaxID=35703 RepID=UPI00388F04DB|nr:hypothetical protein [Citrobacter amalonaticus]